jgi:hypothetical protein
LGIIALPSFATQSVNGIAELPDLVGLGHAMIVLEIDPWISSPRHLERREDFDPQSPTRKATRFEVALFLYFDSAKKRT